MTGAGHTDDEGFLLWAAYEFGDQVDAETTEAVGAEKLAEAVAALERIVELIGGRHPSGGDDCAACNAAATAEAALARLVPGPS